MAAMRACASTATSTSPMTVFMLRMARTRLLASTRSKLSIISCTWGWVNGFVMNAVVTSVNAVDTSTHHGLKVPAKLRNRKDPARAADNG